MQKQCTKCLQVKDLSEFPRRKSSQDGRSWHCLKCTRAYIKAHYLANKQYYVDKARADREELNLLIRKLKEKPCADCKNTFPFYVMDFDHLEGSEKVNCVSILARKSSAKKTMEEISKCDVVCANCHRIRTYNRKHR